MPSTGGDPVMLRLALRGGGYHNGGGAGLFGLNVNCYRSHRNKDVGFRPALAPIRRKPRGQGRADGTGAKGGRSLPGAKRGNNSAPVRQVAQANTVRGQTF